MSYRQFNSPHVASSLPAQRGIPKWVSVAFASHSLALRNEGRPLTTGHCLSNRNTPKLKFLATYRKQSLGQFLIATFRAFPRRAPNFQPAHHLFTSDGRATLAIAPFAFYGSFWRKKGESNRGTMKN